ncbi:precorrin-2 C(20)-methyltransferase [Maribius pontilimi]|uniref:Precorrin-2 C(20)-methyltransferase n=1 Tax=Palleronia pontilimi TaxID=1964209 RepID=A0A934IAR7_9RHOB|nr:precorrin-2 C(20)-methyltransferase [Palleronia pontilimi]MBJ3763628.1 precorrin-2 C(20)-methyltransferase [Palleronia pontilimi]
MSGVLYGVGVGPGDPGLVTRKAARLVAGASVIAYPTLAGAPSFARAIVADLIPEGCDEIVMDLPMRGDRAPAQAVYDDGAARIGAALAGGRDVVCLCEGDPFFYGSFMYLHARLKDRFAIEIVPGVSSVMAASARAALPLAARNERVTILPGPLSAAELEARIAGAEAVAVMKVGRHLPKIRDVIGRLGLLDRAVYVERATLPNERICPLAEAPEAAPYFSMILLNKGDDPWL